MIKLNPHTMGMLFALALLIFSVMCFRNYCTQLKQSDWVTTTATITSVSETRKRTSTKNAHHTVYDIYYVYSVNGQEYDGKIDDLNRSIPIGNTVQIKYNSNAPEESTHITKPAKSVLIMGIVFGAGGLLWLGSHIRSIVAAKKKNRKNELKHEKGES